MLSQEFRTGLDVVRRHWGWFFALGVLLLGLGVFALGWSLLVTLASVVLVGWVLLISGLGHLAHAVRTHGWRGVSLQLVTGILDLVIGVMLVLHPAAGALSLTLVLAAFFIIIGLFQIVGALSQQFPNWGWALVSGLISLLLGGLLWTAWPVSGLWFIGVCVGIGLIFRGWSWVMVALTARRLPRSAA